MKTRTMLWGASILGAGIFFIYLGVHHIYKDTTQAADAPTAQPVSSAYETRLDGQGEVSVEVKPIKIDPKAGSQFEISLETHSVELDADLTKQAFLYDDQSHFIRPKSWDGSEPGGHHRSGVLTFGSMPAPSKYVELKIKNVGDIIERNFRWEIE